MGMKEEIDCGVWMHGFYRIYKAAEADPWGRNETRKGKSCPFC